MITEKSEKLRFARTTALLLTIVFMAFYYYGARAVIVTAISCFVSFFSDYIASAVRRIKFDWTDLSPVLSGILLALLMPATVPYTVIAFSACFMSLICKNAFGGNKNPIFCPVCLAYIFTTFCFPSYVLRYPQPTPFGKLPLTNIVAENLGYSYTYSLDNGSASAFSLLDIIWGKLSGPMGTMAVSVILIAGISLYFFGEIPTAAFFAGFGANVLINVIFPVGDPGWNAVLNSLVAGSFLFVLVFMACDFRYVPKRIFSQVVYGVLFALSSYYIRKYTIIENGAVFTLPLLCIFKDELDRLTGALERLIKFLWKWTRIITSTVIKWLAAMLDRFAEFIARKLVEAKKRHELKIDAAKKEALNENKPDEQENTSITVSEIKIINGSVDSSLNTDALNETSEADEALKSDFQNFNDTSFDSDSEEVKDLPKEEQDD